MEAVQVFNEITEAVEAIKNDDEQQFPKAANVGDFWRQGDIYITKLGEGKLGTTSTPIAERQLAPGTTQGSRHIAEGECTIYQRRTVNALIGPIIESRGCTITHPEHGNVKLPPGVYGITYQRAYAEELRRVLD